MAAAMSADLRPSVREPIVSRGALIELERTLVELVGELEAAGERRT